jgi:uncharacterized protein (DUF427 family)
VSYRADIESSPMKPSQVAIERARGLWAYRGQQRPPFAIEPKAGQESVWDYPRPPAYVPDRRNVEVYAGDTLLVRTEQSIRALETGSPPTFYLPADQVDQARLIKSPQRSFCEWKGEAEYFHVVMHAGRIENALWRYPHALDDAVIIAGYYACYPSLLHCLVDGETVRPQAGGYYGGWVTDEVIGPFKGEPGTGHW